MLTSNTFNYDLKKTYATMMRPLMLLAALLFLIASISQAQKKYDEIDFPELNEFNQPNVEKFTASNGITYFLVEDNELPVIDVSVTIRTGGVLLPNELGDVASITGEVMRSGGTEIHPADTLNQILENRAASIETSIGFTSGSASMNVLKEDFDDLLPVFIDLLMNPKFPEDKIDLAKTQRRSSISRRNDQASSIANREFDNLIYGKDSKYSRTTEYETLNNVTRDDMVDFHNEHFNGANLMVGVVGDFDTKEMKQKLESAFGEIPKGEKTELDFPEVDYEYEKTVNLAHKSDLNQSTVYLGHIGGTRDNPDYAKVQVMNNVLSGGFSGRLFQKVRTDMGLAYSVGGQYGMSNTFYPGKFFAQVQTKSSTTTEAIEAIIQEIKRLQDEPITEEELEEVKDQFLNSLVFRNTSYEQILNREMNNEYRGLPEDAFDEFVEGVRNTTVEDIQEMAQNYLRPDEVQILVVGNKEELGDQLEELGEVNELDISIPQPDSRQEEAVEGDAEKGRELLDKMADAIIEPNLEVTSLHVSGEVSLGAQGTFQSSMRVHYPDERIEQEIQTPQGTIVQSLEGDSGTMSMGGQEQPLPPQAVQGLKSTLNRSFVSIARNANDFDPQFTGTEEFEEEIYDVVSIQINGSNHELLLDQETGLPAVIRYRQFVEQQGKEVQVEDRYSDWQTKSGLTYAYAQVSYVDGNQAAEAIYEDHAVNEDKNEEE